MAPSLPTSTVHEFAPAAPIVREAHEPAELAAIWQFRYGIYIAEMGKPLACADHDRRWLCEPADQEARHLYVAADGAVVGSMRLHIGRLPATVAERLDAGRFGPEAGIGFVSKTMVAAGRRRSQVFAALSQAAYRAFAEAGLTHVLLHCRPSLVPLYERLGFAPYGTAFVDAEVGPQVAMHIAVATAPAVLRRGAETEAA